MNGTFITGCDLHIPYKQPVNDAQHHANMLEIERWAQHYRKNCGGGCSTFIYGIVGYPRNPAE